jgi:hypothetical protein
MNALACIGIAVLALLVGTVIGPFVYHRYWVRSWTADAVWRINNLKDQLDDAHVNAGNAYAAVRLLEQDSEAVAAERDSWRTTANWYREKAGALPGRPATPVPSAIAAITDDDPEPTSQLPAWREALAAIAADDDGVTTVRITHPQPAYRAASSSGAAA